MTHVVQVVYAPTRGGNGSELVAIKPLHGVPRYYDPVEAPSAAVGLALEIASRRVGRGEVQAGDGFTVKVVFVNEDGAPLAPPEPGPGDAAFAEMGAVADDEDG